MSNFQKNSKDYGEPNITYQLAGCAEQRPLGPWDACLSKNHDGTTQQIDDAVGNFETENQVFLQKAQAAQQVRYLLGERAKTKGEFVKGELKAARRQTDVAIADLYRTIIAMLDLMPSDALTARLPCLRFRLAFPSMPTSRRRSKRKSRRLL